MERAMTSATATPEAKTSERETRTPRRIEMEGFMFMGCLQSQDWASIGTVSDLRQSRRLEIVNRSKRVNLGAAQSGFGVRTVPTGPGVGLPSLALGYRDARQLHCAPRSRPSSPAPRSGDPRSSFASLHRSA